MSHILTSADFDSTIATGVTLVDMYADWCGPCQALTPIIEEISQDFTGKATIAKVDVDASPEIAGKFGIMGIPAMLFFKNGELVGKMVGLNAKADIVAELEKHLN